MKYGFTEAGEKYFEASKWFEEQAARERLGLVEEFENTENQSVLLARADEISDENSPDFSLEDTQKSSDFDVDFSFKLQFEHEFSKDTEQQYVVSKEKVEQHIVDALNILGIATRGLTYNPNETTVKIEALKSPENSNRYAVSDEENFNANLDKSAKEFQSFEDEKYEQEMQNSPLRGKFSSGKYGW